MLFPAKLRQASRNLKESGRRLEGRETKVRISLWPEKSAVVLSECQNWSMKGCKSSLGRELRLSLRDKWFTLLPHWAGRTSSSAVSGSNGLKMQHISLKILSSLCWLRWFIRGTSLSLSVSWSLFFGSAFIFRRQNTFTTFARCQEVSVRVWQRVMCRHRGQGWPFLGGRGCVDMCQHGAKGLAAEPHPGRIPPQAGQPGEVLLPS